MFYLIYKTTNIINGKIYIGQHITNNKNDGYLGSGRAIIEDIKKYGNSAFTKEILYEFESFEQMNRKERDLVTLEFVSRDDTYNIQQGGRGWGTLGTCVVLDEYSNRYIRIPKELYNQSIHKTPSSGCVNVIDEQGGHERISSEEYYQNKNKYKTAGSGKVSVKNKKTGETYSIKVEHVDKQIHVPVLGGIVANLNGKNQYVDREKFNSLKLSGVHKGKITAFDKENGIIHHITREEYRNNPERYLPNGKGMVTVFDVELQKHCSVPKWMFLENKIRYKATTTGQKTVWDLNLKSFINIPHNQFDREYHRLAGDKMIVCYDNTGVEKFTFWGSKQDFVEKYGEVLYKAALNQIHNFQHKQHKRFKEYIGCTFKLINWRNK